MSFTRFRLLAISLGFCLAILGSVPGTAAEFRRFDAQQFAAAQQQGLPILVDVHATWCPICASQGRTIRKVVASPKFDKLVIFQIDYDDQKSDWRSFAVSKQGTLIAFRGKQELGRLAFQTDRSKIEGLLASTVH